MKNRLFAVRGAISADNNKADIQKSVAELYSQLLNINNIAEDLIVSVYFTVTDDLTALNPATALRNKGFAQDLPLMCFSEPKTDGSLKGIIRILIQFYGTVKPEPVYLKEAKNLRPDLLQSLNKKSLWIVAREYAGIAEAGGVKNVIKDLAEGSAEQNINTTVFLPFYGCTKKTGKKAFSSEIKISNKKHFVNFLKVKSKTENLNFVFIDTKIFNTKKGIYTYTCEEAKELSNINPEIKKGVAYIDTNEMNTVFQFAILSYAATMGIAPNVLHCHDAHTALLPALVNINAKQLFANTKCFVTIHNAGNSYRQQLGDINYAKTLTGLPEEVLQDCVVDNLVEPFLIASKYAKLTTVSPFYAEEITKPQTSPFSKNFSAILFEKHIQITGITNGIKYENYKPQDKNISLLPFEFDPLNKKFDGKYKSRQLFISEIKNCFKNSKGFSDIAEGVKCFGAIEETENKKHTYFAYHGRLVHQKGIDVLLQTIHKVFSINQNIKFIIMGQGSEDYENKYAKIAKIYSGKLVYFRGYDKRIARMVSAVADFILMPSLFEPCGLSDFIAQIYATIPIAHAVGGLKKIQDGKTGYLFSSIFDNLENQEENMVESLSSIILEKADCFENSEYKHILDAPEYSEIIQSANLEIKNKYSWDLIIKKDYFNLYGF